MLVLVIVARSESPKRTKSGYYVGAILSFASALASLTMIYFQYQGRRKLHSLQRQHSSPTASHPQTWPIARSLPPMVNYHPDSLTTLPFAVSNWSSRRPQRFHSTMRTHDVPALAAYIVGHGNVSRKDDRRIPAPLTRSKGRRADSALSAKRFLKLELELRRQETTNRRISAWLQDTPLPHNQLPLTPLTPPPLSVARQKSPPPTPPSFTLIPPNPLRLRELNREVESYLGIPAPTLPPWPPYSPTPMAVEEGMGIDYTLLPPAIPRPGARGREGVSSDPVTVVFVGPARRDGEKEGSVTEERELRERGFGDDERGGVNGVEVGEGAEGWKRDKERDEERDFAVERWVERMVRGCNVQSAACEWTGPGRKEGKWGRRGWKSR
ncbi:MAG: hypothetical protein Q9220_001132 [cf. Caloplaca sp. 1 TL-2023]